ncbi:MAG TPA: DUF4097 family beta strand repeat-containing protein [Gemmatimonadaceae bacterium]|nr:DUF4097 family beta strand repeat-containing protein [Gemmatimonadaceae bacterium]
MLRPLSLALPAVLLLALPAGAQQRTTGDRDLDWRGRVRDGDWVRVFSHKGEIRVMPGSGDEVEVHGVARGSSAERERVTFEVIEREDGVTICAHDERQRCEEDGLESVGRGWSGRDRSANVILTVRLPRGVHVNAASGNGDVHVERAGGDVRASSGNGSVEVLGAAGSVQASSGNGAVTVDQAHGGVRASSGNGRVRVSTSQGPVRASSGNGSVEVRMASIAGTEDMQFSSGNGRVVVYLPDDFDGELDLTTGHGEAYTDFPVTVRGRLQKSRIQGTVGSGRGPRVRLTSGNGDVEVRKM